MHQLEDINKISSFSSQVDGSDLNEVIQTLAEKTSNEISQVILYTSKYSEMNKTWLKFNVLALLNYCSSKITITKFFVFRDRTETHHNALYRQELLLCQKNNIKTEEIFLNQIDPIEGIDIRDVIIFDKSMCVYCDYNAYGYAPSYHFSSNKNVTHYFADSIQWLRKICHEQSRAHRLQEPLSVSADICRKTAEEHCGADFIDLSGCCWYHSAWQYLRVINKVSSPEWHAQFYFNHFSRELCDSNKRILICGTADYSLLAYIIRTCEDSGIRPNITVLDLCETPLLLCEWYAKRFNTPIQTLRFSALHLSDIKEKYDVICSDAFLTRFTLEQAEKIVASWHSILNDSGCVITTVRVQDVLIDKRKNKKRLKKKYVQDCILRYKKWTGYFEISPNDFKKLAEEYIERITSHDLGNMCEVESIFLRNGFKIEHSNKVLTPGELVETSYDELLCRKVK